MQILSADPYYLIYKMITDFATRRCDGAGDLTNFHRIAAFDAEIYPVFETLRMRLQHGRA